MIQLDARSWGEHSELFGLCFGLSVISQHSLSIQLDSFQLNSPFLKEFFHNFSALDEGLVRCAGTVIEINGKCLPARTVQLPIESSNSISPIFSALIRAVSFSNQKIRLKFKGCTDAPGNLTLDFLHNRILPLYSVNTKFSIKNILRAFHPNLNGRLDITFRPAESIDFPGPLITERLSKPPVIEAIYGMSVATVHLRSRRVAERQITGVRQVLDGLKLPLMAERQYVESEQPGSCLSLWVKYRHLSWDCQASFAFGLREKKAELVGQEAAENLLEFINRPFSWQPSILFHALPFLAISGGQLPVGSLSQEAEIAIMLCNTVLGSEIYYAEDMLKNARACKWLPAERC